MADKKLQDAVDKMVDRLDRTLLRGIQRDGYLCAAKVFENNTWSSEQLAAAVERCQMPSQQLNQFLQQEMQNFQNRIQRCAQDCQDKAQDALSAGGNPSEKQIKRAQEDMDACVSRCVDSHISLLPNVSARFEKAVTQVKQQH
ncbi:Uncharacterized conserved protein [Plasmopara halstedii]|uniref:Uncharacterized conserved protein n=1 Tax=Plasmopara halstedii TaxID=4781 RepID=A0A0P1AZJ1_PLAHL|nr:Uncharacterized conserved protein [Plasmopara halstedii]CEG47033.1 Uncharacterized conserved protein [Plasmopara halstedii]|eukprot:XP_024583402.1 Uncharacterized conserved protein [Plasmopara halstedii]